MKSNGYDLDYFLEWHPRLWRPAICWLIGHADRFSGKRILELGCRSGKMACYFGLLGAAVTGVDLRGVNMDPANREAQKWNVQDRVNFRNYDGDPRNIERNEYDFVFTKSVLVIIPSLGEFLDGLMGSMKIGGELISAENMQTGPIMEKAIALYTGSRLREKASFHGVDRNFLKKVQNVFGKVESKDYYRLVAAIRATRTQ